MLLCECSGSHNAVWLLGYSGWLSMLCCTVANCEYLFFCHGNTFVTLMYIHTHVNAADLKCN